MSSCGSHAEAVHQNQSNHERYNLCFSAPSSASSWWLVPHTCLIQHSSRSSSNSHSFWSEEPCHQFQISVSISDISLNTTRLSLMLWSSFSWDVIVPTDENPALCRSRSLQEPHPSTVSVPFLKLSTWTCSFWLFLCLLTSFSSCGSHAEALQHNLRAPLRPSWLSSSRLFSRKEKDAFILLFPCLAFLVHREEHILLCCFFFYLQDISSGAWQDSLFLPDAGFFVIHIHPQLELRVQFPAQTASQFWVAELTISSKEWWLCALRDLQHIRRRMPFVDAEDTHSMKNSLREASVHHPKPTRLFQLHFQRSFDQVHNRSDCSLIQPHTASRPDQLSMSFWYTDTSLSNTQNVLDSRKMFTAISPVLSFFFHLPSAKASTWLPVSNVWVCLPPSAQLAELLFVSF